MAVDITSVRAFRAFSLVLQGTPPLQVWRYRTRELVAECEGHTRDVRCLAFHPAKELRLLASGGEDGAVRLWQGADEEGPSAPRPRFWGQVLVGSPDGGLLAVVGSDHGLRLFDPGNDEELPVPFPAGGIVKAAFSSDSAWLAASNGRTLYVASTRTPPPA
ncbi:WD40 repeat domain-containing protein [Streptomyces litchfieldiae]|uniref:WD40 repeat domain-containing protein n=1 Tax=Streptomyces litchfieldiae TaxID=3075543 RepID=UPI00374E126F